MTEERTLAILQQHHDLHHGFTSNVIGGGILDDLHVMIRGDQRTHVVETHVAMTLEVVEPAIRILLEFSQFAHRLPFGWRVLKKLHECYGQ